MRISTFFPRLALIQVVFGERIALIDPVARRSSSTRSARCSPIPRGIVVMHSASEDLEALATRFPRGIGQLFDTQIAAAFAGLGAGLGYQKLVREMLGIDLPKAETRSDWLRRPLSPQQIEYAAHDVDPSARAARGARRTRRRARLHGMARRGLRANDRTRATARARSRAADRAARRGRLAARTPGLAASRAALARRDRAAHRHAAAVDSRRRGRARSFRARPPQERTSSPSARKGCAACAARCAPSSPNCCNVRWTTTSSCSSRFRARRRSAKSRRSRR